MYIYTHNTYCFSTGIMVAPTRLNVTLYCTYIACLLFLSKGSGIRHFLEHPLGVNISKLKYGKCCIAVNHIHTCVLE